MAEGRIEDSFHQKIWDTANASSSLERAVSEGRALAYAILQMADETSGAHAQAEHWLDSFGRDPIREARAAEHRRNRGKS